MTKHILLNLMLIALLISILPACSAANITEKEQPEPPEVLDTFPPHGGVVTWEVDIQILFSKPMDKETTAQVLIIFPETSYKIYWDESSQIMTIHPLVPWLPGIIYEVTLTSEASAEDGLNMGEDYTFSFTTNASDICFILPHGCHWYSKYLQHYSWYAHKPTRNKKQDKTTVCLKIQS